MKEFTCPFCNVPYEHFNEKWKQFTCSNCGANLTPEILFNFKIEFTTVPFKFRNSNLIC